MLADIKLDQINTILEPSAGKGDIVDELLDKVKANEWRNRGSREIDIDTIEIDINLQHILKGKGYKVIHNDFLTLQTFKKYDLIILNPPFSEGDKHLLKSLEMQKNGGSVICILNAETLKNPYSNMRKDLVRKLKEYEATIEYMENSFSSAERQTAVEVALIKITIPETAKTSSIITELKKEEYYQVPINGQKKIISSDFLESKIAQYNFEVKAGIRLINEYAAMKPHMLVSLKDTSYNKDSSIITLKVDKDSTHPTAMANSYIRQVRYKYWEALFASDMFNDLFTSNLRTEYHEKIKDLEHYDFSLYNINKIKIEIVNSMSQNIEKTITDLFEDLSNKYHYAEYSKNIHFYNGWKTNKSWIINKKVIIPMYDAFNSWDGRFQCDNYTIINKFTDIEKIFNYLDNGETQENCLKTALSQAKLTGQTKKIITKYFTLTFYKKGTCHIEFSNLEILKKFNIFGSQRKGWLPPSYGKSSYNDMNKEEKAVINEFEGEKEYEKVLVKKDYYIIDTVNLLMLAS